jgi:hypothetical protein
MNTCPPVLAYGMFMMGLGLYDIYMVSFPSLARTLFYLIVGGTFLWILCAAGMDFAAWGLLMVPVVFYIFLFALLVFQKGFDVQSKTQCEKAPEPDCSQESQEEEETCEPDDTCSTD